jgi:hypothetical protein
MIWNGHGRLPALAFEGDELSAIMDFVTRFPNSWEGEVEGTTQVNTRTNERFWKVMHITSPRCPQHYDLFLSEGCADAQLFFHERKKDPSWVFSPHESSGFIYHRVGANLKIKPDRLPPVMFENTHPIQRLANFVFDKRNCRYIGSKIKKLFPGEIVNFLLHRQDREAQNSNFIESLHRYNKGVFKLYTSTQPNTPMQRLGGGKYIFGLTYIFPHAVELLAKCVGNCVMLDATFKAMKPYVLSILHLIVRGESIPIALAVFPSENLNGYKRLYDDVIDVLEKNGVNRGFLTGLPLVSDQGAALRALVGTFRLQWKLCHRHLIENAGASSPHGDWVRRILECCTQVECRRVIDVIRQEFQLLDPNKRAEYQKSSNLALLKRMVYAFAYQCDRTTPLDWLGEFPRPFELLLVPWWAKWLRWGCPTTSNSAESIHSWLNSNKQEMKNASFYGRLELVLKQLWSRIDKRDTVVRLQNRYLQNVARALQAKGAWPPAADSPDFDQWQFSCHLGHAFGDDRLFFSWQYPKFEHPLPASVRVVPEDHPDLPAVWEPEHKKRLARSTAAYLGLLQLDYPSYKQPFPLDLDEDAPKDAHTDDEPVPPEALANVPHINLWYTSAGWAIVRAVRCLTPQQTWKSAAHGWAVVIPRVFEIGHERGFAAPQGRLTDVQEATWRSLVFQERGLY